jgi:SAM-dependent methyltransferase
VTGVAARLRRGAIAGFRVLPPHWRERLKRAVGALGHQPSWAQRLRAQQLAEGAKRLDRWAPNLASMLQAAGVQSLDGCACLEFGSGHLLTEPLLHHLLGARRAVAVDYFPILEESLVRSVCTDVDEDALVTALQPFAPADRIRTRYRALVAREDWSLAGLAELGISYVAPYDAAKEPLEREAFDLIASTSVLEHVPAAQAPAILANLVAMLRPGGVMVHAIHLEDHRDFHNAPLAFLAEDTDWSDADADRRGNRLRRSDWMGMVKDLNGTEVVAADARMAATDLPGRLDPRFAAYERDDLRVGGLVIAIRNQGAVGTT